MKQIIEPAYAKINLTLDVLKKRNDGYHELKMVMQSVALSDIVTVTKNDSSETSGIKLENNWDYLPTDSKNIAYIAANAFGEKTGVDLNGLDIRIEKHIPVCAGTAGGSSDGAAVLRALNKLYNTNLSIDELAKIAESVGSDVPYCVMGGTMLAEGRGEVLTRLPDLPDCYIVMCRPNFAVSTPDLYHKIDSIKIRCRPDTNRFLQALKNENLSDLSRLMYNVFEDALPEKRKFNIDNVKNVMIQNGALGACMSGTGSTTFGIFNNKADAEKAYDYLRESFNDVFITKPVRQETICLK